MWDHWQARRRFSSNKVDDYDWAFPRDEEVMDGWRSVYVLIHKHVQGRIDRVLAVWKSRGDFLYKCK